MHNSTSFAEKVRWRVKSLENAILKYRLSTNETEVIETEYGKVKGAKRKTIYDDTYYSFEGIPYAQPPLGDLRFKAPQRPTPWDNTLDCTNAKDKATQVNFIFDKMEGSEDCLYLNVYTNNLKPNKPRSVMVWIHGGGFILGEANRDMYGPDYFMKHDVILITIQYRLGVLGFLSLNEPTLNVPGNAGLKDQVLALKWVKNNCTYFGGNSNCITVFGESAGGASTNYMLITDQSQGLFHRAILQSGCSLASWAISDVSKRAYSVAKLVGYKGENNDKDVYEYLQKANAKDLIRIEEKALTIEDRKNNVMFAFGPTIEPYSSTDCVVPKAPKDMMKKAWGNHIPIMFGNTSYEGLLFKPIPKQHPAALEELKTCVSFVPNELADPDRSSDTTKDLGLKIKNIHVSGENATLDEYMEMCSYLYFLFPMHRFIQSRLHYAANIPIYIYRFDFDSEQIIQPFRIMREGRGVKGVGHADELTFLFWNLLARRLNKDSPEYKTIERMVGIWTQFANTGNPNSEKINGMESISWLPLEKSDNTYKCLNIGNDLSFIELPEMEKIRKWADVYGDKKELLYQ